MFDTMTMTKILGAFCGALLVFLLGSWAAETLYHTGGGGHGDHAKQAYVIEVEGADDHGGEAEEEAPSMEEMMANADIAKGKKVFGKCKACHKLEDGANSTGPTLYNIIGRPVQAVGDFSYSGALEGTTEAWTEDALFGFLASPKAFAPGTSMAFAGLKKPKDRANVIAYLSSLNN